MNPTPNYLTKKRGRTYLVKGKTKRKGFRKTMGLVDRIKTWRGAEKMGQKTLPGKIKGGGITGEWKRKTPSKKKEKFARQLTES